LVLENIDDLFDRQELSAVRDPGWPDCFNSGVFVYVPNDATYTALMQHAITTGSYDGGDQGLLNSFFGDWGFTDMKKHLPYVYNCCSVTFYSYLPALKQFASKVKVVHFIGADKPWTKEVGVGDETSDKVTGLPNFQQCWWNLFRESIEDKLKALDLNLHSGGHLVLATGTSSSHHTSSFHQATSSGHAHSGPAPDRQQEWETGRADYRGVDKSDNIMAKIKSTIGPTDTTTTFPAAAAASTEEKKTSPTLGKKK